MKNSVAALFLLLGLSFGWSQASKPPVTYAIIGLAHDHANGFLPRARNRPELQLAGIVEPNQDLVARYSRTLNLPTNLFSPSLEALLARTNIQAVATFTSTFQHRQVVEMCAARGIHVMMEKPLAVSLADARAMAAAAKKGGIQVIVNYETTWYPGNQNAYAIVHDQHAIGDMRKIVVHDGHRGPKEIGCSAGFPGMADRPGAQRRRRPHRFRLLRRRPGHLADGWPAPHLRAGGHAADQAGRLSQGGR